MPRGMHNIPEMELQIRKAALAFIPSAANATWRTPLVTPLNAFGEPEDSEEPHFTTTPVAVYAIDYRARAGRFNLEGINSTATQRFLVALPDPPPELDTPWSPVLGDILDRESLVYRVTEIHHLDVDGTAYYEVTGELISP